MNNPAARLHQILSLCKKHEKESGSRPMLTGWRKVFQMAEGVRDFAVMERIGRVYGLAGDIVDRVSRYHDLDPQLYLCWREELEDAFVNLSFRSEFDTFARRIPKTLIANIEFCSNALSERCPEAIVDSETLGEIAQLTADLIQALPEADLDEAGRRYFLDYLELIRRAVDDYWLAGAPGLQRAVDACTGTLVTQRQVSLRTRETPVGRKFWSLTHSLAKALAAPQEGEDTEIQGATKHLFKPVVREQTA